MILKGSGKRIVGDNIEYFTDNDLVFIGRLLPHASYIGKDYLLTNQDFHALVIYFHPDWFNENLLNSSDFVKLKKVESQKNRKGGIKIFGNTKTRTPAGHPSKLKNTNGLERIIRLLNILDFISKSGEYKCSTSEGYLNSYGQNDIERLSEV